MSGEMRRFLYVVFGKIADAMLFGLYGSEESPQRARHVCVFFLVKDYPHGKSFVGAHLHLKTASSSGDFSAMSVLDWSFTERYELCLVAAETPSPS